MKPHRTRAHSQSLAQSRPFPMMEWLSAVFVTLAVLRKNFNQSALSDAKELGDLYEAIEPDDAARAMRFWRMRRDVAA